jgi:DNA-binding NarL/FixJ family response regulator
MGVAQRGNMHLEIVDESLESATTLARLWRLLMAGQLFIEATYCLEGRCFGVVARRARQQPARAESVEILERVFESESQKAVAYELGLSIATVATHSASVLDSICTKHLVSRAPIIVVMAALAARGVPLGSARFDEARSDGRWVLSVEVPAKSLRNRLSQAEYEVAQLTIEGASHAQIAQARASSVRTVANQLASVFQKLDASGRAALRTKAIHEYAALQARSTPPASVPINTVALPALRGLDACWERSPGARSRPDALPMIGTAAGG